MQPLSPTKGLRKDRRKLRLRLEVAADSCVKYDLPNVLYVSHMSQCACMLPSTDSTAAGGLPAATGT